MHLVIQEWKFIWLWYENVYLCTVYYRSWRSSASGLPWTTWQRLPRQRHSWHWMNSLSRTSSSGQLNTVPSSTDIPATCWWESRSSSSNSTSHPQGKDNTPKGSFYHTSQHISLHPPSCILRFTLFSLYWFRNVMQAPENNLEGSLIWPEDEGKSASVILA